MSGKMIIEEPVQDAAAAKNLLRLIRPVLQVRSAINLWPVELGYFFLIT